MWKCAWSAHGQVGPTACLAGPICCLCRKSQLPPFKTARVGADLQGPESSPSTLARPSILSFKSLVEAREKVRSGSWWGSAKPAMASGMPVIGNESLNSKVGAAAGSGSHLLLASFSIMTVLEYSKKALAPIELPTILPGPFVFPFLNKTHSRFLSGKVCLQIQPLPSIKLRTPRAPLPPIWSNSRCCAGESPAATPAYLCLESDLLDATLWFSVKSMA